MKLLIILTTIICASQSFAGTTTAAVETTEYQLHQMTFPCGVCEPDTSMVQACQDQIQKAADTMCRNYGLAEATDLYPVQSSKTIFRSFCYNEETNVGGVMSVADFQTSFNCK